jgi:hypothetical protein
MTSETPVAVVEAWQEALNARDAERVLELSSPDIAVVGPRGVGRGQDLLRAWLAHAWVTLEPLRTFARGKDVVVVQRGSWRDPETGEAIGEAEVASHFRARAGKVVHYARYDTLDEALTTAGLEPGDELAR